MFDRRFLPEAELEFVLVSDTHYMLDMTGRQVEFESRRRQSARAERALQLIGRLAPPFVVHLGDLVQEYPETERYRQAMAEAREQLARCGVQPYQAAGNQDIGDKPDPTMPTNPVTPESLASFHKLFGRSWYSWDAGPIHCIVLNSQLLNTDLPEAAEQERWLEEDLAANSGRRIFLFLHLGLFLKDEQEPFLGHYDNIAEPGRSWLIGLIRRYRIEMVFSGHSHFAFFNRINGTRYYNVVSTSFTRPGFSQLFSSGPPPEQGRDDAKKLGFYLIRVFEVGASVQFIRTYGETAPAEAESAGQFLISRISRDLPHSPLGLVLRHPLAQTAEVPVAWPSIIRQPVRNDYPFLSCIELGVRQVTVPATDLAEPLQSRRLGYLRDEGVSIRAAWLWTEQLNLREQVHSFQEQVDEVELQLSGALLPNEACLRAIRNYKAQRELPLTIAPIIPNERVPGKQHLRTRLGYRLAELAALNQHLVQQETRVDRVLCRVEAGLSPWETMTQGLELNPLTHIGVVDWAVEFAVTDERAQVSRAGEALFAAALLPGARLFLEPLVDLDRTMDVTYGLLDRMHNPRPAFNVVRYLNTILFALPEVRRPIAGPEIEGLRVLGLKGPASVHWLLLPAAAGQAVEVDVQALPELDEGVTEVDYFFLEQGKSQSLALNEGQRPAEGFRLRVGEATLVRFKR